MKKIAVILLSLFLCVMCSACGVVYFWDSLYKVQEKEYYSVKENFVSVEAICDEITVIEQVPDRYYVKVEDMVYEKTEECRFIDSSFVIIEPNATILREAGVEEKLSPGDVFTFISAPEYFGDGYKCPIVSLEIDGEVLLDFETGYANLMATYN